MDDEQRHGHAVVSRPIEQSTLHTAAMLGILQPVHCRCSMQAYSCPAEQTGLCTLPPRNPSRVPSTAPLHVKLLEPVGAVQLRIAIRLIKS